MSENSDHLARQILDLASVIASTAHDMGYCKGSGKEYSPAFTKNNEAFAELKKLLACRRSPNIEFLLVAKDNPIVAATIKAGGNSEDCVVALANHNRDLLQRVIDLEKIAPRRVVVGDHSYIWRCPDDMVPTR